MDLKQFSQKLQQAADEIKAEAPKIVRRAGMDALAVVERRIKQEGIPGAKYKSKGKAAYFQGGKGTGAKKNYATHGKVDLTLTNRMWNSTAVLGTVQLRENVYQAQLGATDQEGDTKLIANLARFGDFLEPNESEQEELLEDTVADVIDIVKKHIG